jgi:hypothetical protein
MNIIFQSFMFQTILPTRIIILQNMIKRVFDFPQLTGASKVPLLHVWATNWNTFFYLTCMVMMFLPEPYSFKLGDDQVCDNPNDPKNYVRAIEENPNPFIRLVDLKVKTAYCDVNLLEFGATNYNDHMAKIVLYQSHAGKVLHRFRPYAYIGAEDIAISATNSMDAGQEVCSGPSLVSNMRQMDTHVFDREIAGIVAQLSKGKTYPLLIQFYCHYIKRGYRPMMWKTV